MGDKVFLLCEEGAVSDAPLLVCLDAKKGGILWQQPVDHLDAWPDAKQTEAKELRRKELQRWREHMTWWNKLYWNDATNQPAKHDKATWDRIAAEALAAGWQFTSHDKAELSGPADCGNGAYRGRYGRSTGRMNGQPTDPSLMKAYSRVGAERIYWRPGWTSEGPFYGNAMGSVVGDGKAIYAIPPLKGAAALISMGNVCGWPTSALNHKKSGLPAMKNTFTWPYLRRSSPMDIWSPTTATWQPCTVLIVQRVRLTSPSKPQPPATPTRKAKPKMRHKATLFTWLQVGHRSYST